MTGYASGERDDGRDEGEEGQKRAGGCKDAAAPNARFVSTRATFV